MLAQGRVVGLDDRRRVGADLQREIEHRLLPRRDLGLAMVHRDLIGDERVLLVDAQDRAVRDHAVEAVVRRAGGDDDHLLLAFGQARRLEHQRIVIGEERAELVGSMGQGEEDVGDETRFLLHLEDPSAQVFGQVGNRRDRVATDRKAHAATSLNCSACSLA